VVESVRRYILKVVRATREHPVLSLGASPRGSLALFRAAQANAALRGRDFVIPDDVKQITEICLVHRMAVNPENSLSGETTTGVLHDLIKQIEVPLTESKDASQNYHYDS
jgi:MoxR-like ATPase